MKKALLLLFSVITFSFGMYATYRIIFKNRAPYTMACDGIILDKAKIYSFDNSNHIFSKDTIQINFENAKAIMPSHLGFVVFKNNEWTFEPTSQIKFPSEKALLSPTCRSLKTDVFNNGKYFSGTEIVPQEELLEGIKINTPAGDKTTRVLIHLLKVGSDFVLKTNAEGLLTQYLVASKLVNKYGVYFNEKPVMDFKNNYLFSKLSLIDTASYQVQVKANTFKASVDVLQNGLEMQSWSGANKQQFKIKNMMFSLTPKLGYKDLVLLVCTILICLIFQVLLLREALIKPFASPIIWALFSTRILFNCLFFLAIPTYVLALTASGGRWLYLASIVVFNLSIFFNRERFHFLINLKMKRNFAILCLFIAIFFLPLFWKFSYHEAFLGVIPTLHLLKWILLLFILSVLFFFKEKNIKNNLPKYVLILAYALAATILTKDFGSLLYTIISLVLIALVTKDKKIKPSNLFFIAVGTISIFYLVYTSNHEFVSGKTYRLYAPYTSPDDVRLSAVKEGDREFFAMINLNLKNILSLQLPKFENINIPANARSTGFSDYAVHWSFTIGGFLWAIIFLVTIGWFLYNLLFLLFCSSREIKIKQNLFFIFPVTIEAELLRFLLAFCCVGLLYPIVSNLCLLPLTGQSILVLSISVFEVLFFTLSFILFELIFSNPAYYFETKSGYKYTGNNLKLNVATSFISLCFLFFIGLFAKAFHLKSLPQRFEWPISLHNRQEIKLPASKDSLKYLVEEKFKDADSFKEEDKILLKEAASRIYTGQPYSAHVYTPKRFGLSTQAILGQMLVDSIFSYKRKPINGPKRPFGEVFSFDQKVNGRGVHSASNPLYKCIPIQSTTINADLTAELNQALDQHIELLPKNNIGGVMIVDRFGGIVSNATFPYDKDFNVNDKDYFIGSVKKVLLAYAALTIDPNYKNKVWQRRSFKNLIVNSDSYYAGELLRDLLKNHRAKFESVLKSDFNLELVSSTGMAFMDDFPMDYELMNTQLAPNSKNNGKSKVYRYAIGQQKPYPFRTVMNWYHRIAFNAKREPSFYKVATNKEPLSIANEDLKYLHGLMNGVLQTTAANVGRAFQEQHIVGYFSAKTGTAEHSDRTYNQSSSFVIFNEQYCIGIFFNGNVPDNNAQLGAKHLFENLIPILVKYEVLKR
ncbi:hypothetical protein EGI22_16105 [Lacihabitans sp. LS3-19]|uniref:hypothetical protein n=1 Tax=Lacihabitans sp. LS3-19 TaxID=2487335 RepID=UPI0020CD5FD0|nr:hypothetical protein [Lacihabitans sp. LS3-19]MCP9769427.1 hypothetical protein [Lacihabitans sp. LS3-19]